MSAAQSSERCPHPNGPAELWGILATPFFDLVRGGPSTVRDKAPKRQI
jgi:hypothetical protein